MNLLAKWFRLFFHKQRAQVWIQISEIPKHWYIFKILWWLCHEKYEELRIKKAIREWCVWLFITQVHDVHVHMCVHDLNRCSALSACVSQHQATKCALTQTCSIQSFRVTELDSWAAKNTHVHECIRRFQRNPQCFYVHFNRGGAGALFLSAEISHSLSLLCLFPLFSFCVIILISYFLTPSIFRHAPSAFISPLSCVVFFN